MREHLPRSYKNELSVCIGGLWGKQVTRDPRFMLGRFSTREAKIMVRWGSCARYLLAHKLVHSDQGCVGSPWRLATDWTPRSRVNSQWKNAEFMHVGACVRARVCVYGSDTRLIVRENSSELFSHVRYLEQLSTVQFRLNRFGGVSKPEPNWFLNWFSKADQALNGLETGLPVRAISNRAQTG